MSDEDMKRILKYAGEYQDRLHWATIRNAIRERKGYPVMIARKPSSPGRTRGAGAEAAAEPEEAAPYEPSEEEVKEAAAKVLDGIYEEEDRKKSQPRKRTLNP